jgi:inhibitor of KinA
MSKLANSKHLPILIQPFGQKAIEIAWKKDVSEQILYANLLLTSALKQKFNDNWEFISSYNTLTLVYNGVESFSYPKLVELINKQYDDLVLSASNREVKWVLPVCYDEVYGIDLYETANFLKLSASELINLHTTSVYTIYGIGFLPGFMYLGGLPQTLEIPRKSVPRLKVEKGAVGLASKQTGIYPQASPGGWNIIGNCPVPLFDVSKNNPCFFSVGDKVQFKSITQSEYEHIKIQMEVGIYEPEKVVIDA